MRPDLTTEEVQSFVTGVARDWVTTASATVKKFLLASQLFTESNQSTDFNYDSQGLKTALVWGTLGLLITLQTDWVLGRIIARTMPTSSTATQISPTSSSEQKASLTSEKIRMRKRHF